MFKENKDIKMVEKESKKVVGDLTEQVQEPEAKLLNASVLLRDSEHCNKSAKELLTEYQCGLSDSFEDEEINSTIEQIQYHTMVAGHALRRAERLIRGLRNGA